jgi:hypothetical protein
MGFDIWNLLRQLQKSRKGEGFIRNYAEDYILIFADDYNQPQIMHAVSESLQNGTRVKLDNNLGSKIFNCFWLFWAVPRASYPLCSGKPAFMFDLKAHPQLPSVPHRVWQTWKPGR